MDYIPEIERHHDLANAKSGTSPIVVIGIVFLTVWAIVVRVPFLSQSMRYDEAYTYLQYASRPLIEGLTNYTAPNNHLLHTALVHMMVALFGNQPWVIRIPAMLGGVSLVPMVFLVGRRYYSDQAGLLGAGLVAGSSVLVEFSTNARGYSLVAALSLALFLIVARLADEDRPLDWALLIVVSVLGFITIPVMLYSYAVGIGWLCLTAALERKLRLIAKSAIASLFVALFTVAAYVPASLEVGAEAITSNQWVQSLEWSVFLERLPRSLESTWAEWTRDLPSLLVALLTGAFILALLLHTRIGRTRLPLALPAVLVVLILLAVQRVVPFNRVWLFLLPVFLLTAAAGATFLFEAFVRERRGQQGVLALIAVLTAVTLGLVVMGSDSVRSSTRTGLLRDAADVAAYVGEYESSAVLTMRPSQYPLRYHTDALGLEVPVLTGVADEGGLGDRVVAVVNLSSGQTIDEVVTSNGLDPRDYETTLLREFHSAVVYGLTRLSG